MKPTTVTAPTTTSASRMTRHVVDEAQPDERQEQQRREAQSVDQADDDADDLPGAAAEDVAEQPQFQSEKLCNHSMPSAALRPPASSTKRSSRVCRARTSSRVPDGEHAARAR